MVAPRPPLGALRVLTLSGALVAAALAVLSCRGAEVLHDSGSGDERIRVMEEARGVRSLYLGAGRARQSALDPLRPRHLEVPYTRVAMVGLALVPDDARILFVGLGGGAMPTYTHAVMPRARIQVVEIDPAVVEVASRYFGFRTDERMSVHVDDGRAFIARAPPESYDLVVLDAFSDDQVPRALATREFLQSVRASLAPRGVVVSNLWSSSAEYASMVATYRAVFGEVRTIGVPRRAQRILVTPPGQGRLDRTALVEASEALARRVELGFDLPSLVRRGFEVPRPGGAPILEDLPAAGAAPGGPEPATSSGRRSRADSGPLPRPGETQPARVRDSRRGGGCARPQVGGSPGVAPVDPGPERRVPCNPRGVAWHSIAVGRA